MMRDTGNLFNVDPISARVEKIEMHDESEDSVMEAEMKNF
jgi:hypothetical protein